MNDYKRAKRRGDKSGFFGSALKKLLPKSRKTRHRFMQEGGEPLRHQSRHNHHFPGADTPSEISTNVTSRCETPETTSTVDFLTGRKGSPQSPSSPDHGGLTAKQLRAYNEGNPYSHLPDLEEAVEDEEEPTPRQPSPQ